MAPKWNMVLDLDICCKVLGLRTDAPDDLRLIQIVSQNLNIETDQIGLAKCNEFRVPTDIMVK